MQLNFFFLLNIIRVLVKKIKESQEDSYIYLKAVRATLILVPLLGVQFVILPWRPSHPVFGKIYDFVMHSLIHFQVRGDALSDSLPGEGGTMDAATLSATWSSGHSCLGLLCDENEPFEHTLPGREVALSVFLTACFPTF